MDLRAGSTIDYTPQFLQVEGTLAIREQREPATGQVVYVFALTDAVVSGTKPLFGEQ